MCVCECGSKSVRGREGGKEGGREGGREGEREFRNSKLAMVLSHNHRRERVLNCKKVCIS